MPSFDRIFWMSETDSACDQITSERAGRSDKCDPARNGKPAAHPGDPLMIRPRPPLGCWDSREHVLRATRWLPNDIDHLMWDKHDS
jgi:hypothetical protein